MNSNVSLAKRFKTFSEINLQQLLPVISYSLDNFLRANPSWAFIFFSAVGLYGVYLAYNQDRLNEITEFIKENPEKFSQSLVETEEFKNAFLVYFDYFLKQRNRLKREIAKKIFLGYAVSTNKEKFELERLNASLDRISIESLSFLFFFKEKILITIKKALITELENDQYRNSDRSIEWWSDQLLRGKSIWIPIDKWLHDTFNPEMQTVKGEYKVPAAEGWPPDLRHRAETREREKRTKMNECLTELLALGVVKTSTTGMTFGGGGGTDYHLTGYGINFIQFLESISEELKDNTFK